MVAFLFLQNDLADVEQLMNIIYDFLLLAAVLTGFGHHVWDVQLSEYEELAKVC